MSEVFHEHLGEFAENPAYLIASGSRVSLYLLCLAKWNSSIPVDRHHPLFPLKEFCSASALSFQKTLRPSSSVVGEFGQETWPESISAGEYWARLKVLQVFLSPPLYQLMQSISLNQLFSAHMSILTKSSDVPRKSPIVPTIIIKAHSRLHAQCIQDLMARPSHLASVSNHGRNNRSSFCAGLPEWRNL